VVRKNAHAEKHLSPKPPVEKQGAFLLN